VKAPNITVEAVIEASTPAISPSRNRLWHSTITKEIFVKRSAIAAAVCAGLALSLAACSSSSGGTTEGGGEKVNLVVWESLEGRAEFIKQAGEAYTAKHPNITIEYKNVELGDAPGQIALDGPGGVGPDVFAAGSNVIGNLVVGGHILPVNDPQALKDQLEEGAIKAVTYDEKVWGVPVTIDTIALYYNKKYVTDPPKTWEDVIKFAQKFNAENPGKHGIAFSPNSYYASPFLFQAPDSLLFGPTGDDPKKPNLNTDVARKGLKQLTELRKVLNIPGDDLDAAVTDTLFESGQSAMTLTGSWNTAPFTDAKVDFGVTTMPALAGSDKPAGAFVNSRSMFVSAYSEHPKEAADFAAFLASPEMLKLAYEITGSIPSAKIEVGGEAVAGLIAQSAYAFPSPSIPEANLFWTAMDSAVTNIWNGADIQAELKTAEEVVLKQ
jgi:arabinogalactan oligomer / maltooligosaccharide transport system substrate-binding protein